MSTMERPVHVLIAAACGIGHFAMTVYSLVLYNARKHRFPIAGSNRSEKLLQLGAVSSLHTLMWPIATATGDGTPEQAHQRPHAPSYSTGR